MNKAFEKILERLEEEREHSYTDFSEYVSNFSPCLDSEYDDFFHRGLERASKVIKEVKQSYNNGWIPCSEKLPDEHKLYDITFKNDAGIHSDSAIYNPYLKRWFWDADETELVESKIIAWAEKRQPYKESEHNVKKPNRP